MSPITPRREYPESDTAPRVTARRGFVCEAASGSLVHVKAIVRLVGYSEQDTSYGSTERIAVHVPSSHIFHERHLSCFSCCISVASSSSPLPLFLQAQQPQVGTSSSAAAGTPLNERSQETSLLFCPPGACIPALPRNRSSLHSRSVFLVPIPRLGT